MKSVNLSQTLRVSADRLYREMDPGPWNIDSTEGIPALDHVVGQNRARDALSAAMELPFNPFHVYVAGEAGSAREALVRQIVQRHAEQEPVPSDWVLLFNFQEPDHPFALPLPPGQGSVLVKKMDDFVRSALREIPHAFESEAYEKRKHEALAEVHKKKKEALEHLRESAKAHHVTIETTLTGFVSIPLRDGKPVPTEEFEKLPDKEKKNIQKRAQDTQAMIHATLRELHHLNEEEEVTTRKLDREIAQFALGALFDELKERYSSQPRLLQQFSQIQEDLLEHLEEFRSPGAEDSELSRILSSADHARPGKHGKFNRYRVNLLVDHSQTRGAPLIFEHDPSYYNLFGKLEYRATFGAMATDLMEIKSGSVLRANGGFLVLDAWELLKNFHSWDTLKRTLKEGFLRIENLGDQFTLVPVATLRPEPIPIRLKVILIGSRHLHHLLFRLDEDFRTLFKIKAEFDPEMDWNDANVESLLGFISYCVKKNQLRPFDASALARIVEHASRLCSNQKKLTTRLAELETLAVESNAIALRAKHSQVTAEDVEQAIERRTYHSNLLEAKIQEWITEGTLLIDTATAQVGQVNGVAVIDSGDYSFGRPTRITASVSIGRGGIRSIERESKLSGRIHSKGFLILSGFLRSKYAQNLPLSLGATITFEQSYDEVEGDSASSAELYALLSALAGVPVRQGIAVTGACNQHGEVQAVGGINEKIEGYFAICEKKGLTGDQGIIIPQANVKHLMLKKHVREAVRERLFNIWAVNHVDQGLELLTGLAAENFHEQVQAQLKTYADQVHSFIAQEIKRSA